MLGLTLLEPFKSTQHLVYSILKSSFGQRLFCLEEKNPTLKEKTRERESERVIEMEKEETLEGEEEDTERERESERARELESERARERERERKK